ALSQALPRPTTPPHRPRRPRRIDIGASLARGTALGLRLAATVASVSFDIYFVPRGVPFDEAMDQLADAAGSGDPLSTEQVARWRRIETSVRAVLPGADVFASDSSRELTDGETGVQLCQYGAEISLSAPYWEEGEEAARIVGL